MQLEKGGCIPSEPVLAFSVVAEAVVPVIKTLMLIFASLIIEFEGGLRRDVELAKVMGALLSVTSAVPAPASEDAYPGDLLAIARFRITSNT